MTIEPIRVYEHESLKVDEQTFTSKHLELLSKYLGDKGGDDFPYYSLINNGVKFKQYVGVISVGHVHIEVLPKADKYTDDKDVWEHHLLEMLRAVYNLKVKLPSNADQRMKHSPVLDVFLDHFMDEVEHIMHVGLVKSYRRIEDNCTALRGRLVMSKHIVKNIIHKERFYVDYTTYDRNHLFNRLLYKALHIIPDISSNNYTIHRAKTLLFEFPELNDIVATETLFNSLVFNRKTKDYRHAMDLAKMILLNYMPDMTYKRGNNVIALMFDMNKLWEEYVYLKLRHQLTDYTVLKQDIKLFWHSDSFYEKTIRPDIVIMKDLDCVAVLDTKWKCPTDGRPNDSDLKQMYVYHKYWDTDHTALIYPGNSRPLTGCFIKENKDFAECRMYFLPILPDKDSLFLKTEELVSFIKSVG